MVRIASKPSYWKKLQPAFNTLFVAFFILGLSSSALSQEKKGKRININNADKGIYQKGLGKNRLLGNVIFEHEGALMYCDSAWLFSEANKIRAFENVYINQGDTIELWGDYLEYSGNTKIATVTGKEVRLKDKKMELITDRLKYDRKNNQAYYYTGGEITSDENFLVSQQGFYNSKDKLFQFKDSVVLTNPDYVIESDTMLYSSNSRKAFFHGPTTITSDSSFIYCENGRYNTVTDIAQFEKNAYLYNDNKYLTGDSLYYEKHNEFGEAFENVLVHDTVDDYTITGGYAQYLGRTDSTFVTYEPIYSVKQEKDTLHIHGDTLFSTKVMGDSLEEFRLIKAYHKVKFFKSDIQGKCDSLTYATQDSMIRMYHEPLIWNDSSQVSGDTIYLTLKNDKLDSLKVYSNAFIINQIDEVKYNQIKGRKMFGKFAKNKIHRVFVNGNGQTLYFPKDKNEGFIGMNKAICSNIIIKFKDNDVSAITFLTKPEAKLHPMREATGPESKLEGFKPRYDERPNSKAEILIW